MEKNNKTYNGWQLVLESPVRSGFSVSRDPNRDPNRLAFLPEPKITGLDRK